MIANKQDPCRRKKILRRQRLAGVVAVLCCVVVLVLALTGETPGERDVTPLLFMIPLAWFMLTTKLALFR